MFDISKPTILLDCDHVWLDFNAFQNFVWKTRLRYKPLDGWERTHPLITFSPMCPARTHRAFVAACSALTTQLQHLKPFPGSVGHIRQLARVANIVPLTAGWPAVPTWEHDRYTLISQKLSQDIANNYVFTTLKFLVDGDIFIDDHPDHIFKWKLRHPNGTAILWRAPHNSEVGDMPRPACDHVYTDDWQLVKGIVNHIIEERHG